MDFRYFLPTQIYFGEEALLKHSSELTRWGKKALIVTGASSAVKSGALGDITKVLEQAGISYRIFSEVEENPSMETVEKGCALLKEWGGDFVIGCGGGSPLDAGKAIALLAAQRSRTEDFFTVADPQAMLPYIAIPLTAGTGSEVTPYAIITDVAKGMKKNLSTPSSFPVVAFLDPRYTASMSLAVTRNTGIDALSHAIEGFLSRRATIISDLLALEAIKLFKEALPSLQSGKLTLHDRSTLLYSSLLAGIVITHTGTCLVHALGYNLTINHGVPHGAANGYLLGPFLEFLEEAIPEKTDQILKALGLDFTWQINPLFAPLLPEKNFSLSSRELEQYGQNTLAAKGTAFTSRLPLKEDVVRILLQMA